jgi:RNA polymerase sigma-70 factor (ECF subfamily)
MGQMSETAQMVESPLTSAAAPEQQAAFVQLLERAQQGDPLALDQIMILSQRRVASTAWRLLGNEEDARDATQEVFLKAFKYLDSFDRERDFYGWLYGITVNVCNDHLRKRRQRADHFSSLETAREEGRLEELASADDDAGEAVMREQQKALIGRALAKLTDKERAVIVLRDLEGVPAKEVARMLNASEGTVRAYSSSGRAKIKTYCDRFMQRKSQA